MPFSTVSNVGFQKMLHTFEPRYVLPDGKTITQHYMPEIHEQVKSSVTEAMKRGLVYFSLTTDTWMFRANHSYIMHTVTWHQVSFSQFNQCSTKWLLKLNDSFNHVIGGIPPSSNILD